MIIAARKRGSYSELTSMLRESRWRWNSFMRRISVFIELFGKYSNNNKIVGRRANVLLLRMSLSAAAAKRHQMSCAKSRPVDNLHRFHLWRPAFQLNRRRWALIIYFYWSDLVWRRYQNIAHGGNIFANKSARPCAVIMKMPKNGGKYTRISSRHLHIWQ